MIKLPNDKMLVYFCVFPQASSSFGSRPKDHVQIGQFDVQCLAEKYFDAFTEKTFSLKKKDNDVSDFKIFRDVIDFFLVLYTFTFTSHFAMRGTYHFRNTHLLDCKYLSNARQTHLKYLSLCITFPLLFI